MEKTVKRQRFAIIILALVLVFGFFYMNETKTELENRYNSLSNQYNNLNSQINSIYNNVDEKLKQQASLITSFDYNYGELDRENLKVPVSVKITPKTTGSSTKLILDFGGRTVEMKKGENMEYTAEFESDLFVSTENETVKLLIINGDTTESEELDWYITSFHGNFLPKLDASLIFDDTEFTEENGLKVEGDIIFFLDDEEEIRFKNMKLFFRINDKIISEDDVSEYLTADTRDRVEINKNFPDVKAGDTFCLYLEAEDECGFIHRKTLKEVTYTSDDVTTVTVEADTKIILDKDGNVLYGGKK